MPIKHIVLSGGGPGVIQSLGILNQLSDSNYLFMDDIESIYATSAGGILGVMICCKYEWETLNDYIIKRPWNDVFHILPTKMLSCYSEKGFLNEQPFNDLLKPLLLGRHLSPDISLEQFYNWCNIELHLFAVDINTFEAHDISYKTHPTLSLMSAIHMTCAIPGLITPVCIGDACYVDGGIISNFPLTECLHDHSNTDEILACRSNTQIINSSELIGPKSTMIDFLYKLLSQLLYIVYKNTNQYTQSDIPNTIVYDMKTINGDILLSSVASDDIRLQLFDAGVMSASTFLLHNCPID